MSLYKCLSCGSAFDGEELDTHSEYMGDYCGGDAYEESCCCPHCGGDYAEAYECKMCGESFLCDEISDDVCEKCLDEIASDYKYDIAKCYSLSQKCNEKDNVSIDYFLSCMFTPEQINEVLYRELVSACAITPIDCTPFIEADRCWFNDRVVKEV